MKSKPVALSIAAAALAALTLTACGITTNHSAQPNGVAVAKGTPPASLAQAAALSKTYDYCENIAGTLNPAPVYTTAQQLAAPWPTAPLVTSQELQLVYQEQALFSAAAAKDAPSATLSKLLTARVASYDAATSDLQRAIVLMKEAVKTHQRPSAAITAQIGKELQQSSNALFATTTKKFLIDVPASCPALNKYITTAK